ncbi:hypothetical protein DNTS_004394 [Danionella cerebrum]|uniref:Uncharacterized protein n=1 Tax=Danionella cerebrum TaxID=2873325 RepID=A0A553NH50_9TELE|nr:hypothetical protein DNTS_004394 [Danionella translucida]
MNVSVAADKERGAKKVRVKRRIRSIVDELENILGDLKDVAKELKEVVEEIDCLTSALHLEEGQALGCQTDTLNSSSSSSNTTNSSVKIYPEDTAFTHTPPHPLVSSSILTVMKKPNPPPPPPRSEDTAANGALMLNPVVTTIEKVHASRCPQTTRERVRFSEKVQYHGYCPDCDVQCETNELDLHLHSEIMDHKPTENGGIGCPSLKPQKTILRKSTSTTVPSSPDLLFCDGWSLWLRSVRLHHWTSLPDSSPRLRGENTIVSWITAQSGTLLSHEV